MPASSTKLPEKALKIVPLVKKNFSWKISNENTMKLKVAEKTEESQNVPVPTTPEHIFLTNKNKSLKFFQSVSEKPFQKSNLSEDVLDLSVASRTKSPEKKITSSSQSSDRGWDFLEKPC